MTDADARRIVRERDALLRPVTKEWRAWLRRENRALIRSVGNPTSVELAGAMISGNAVEFYAAKKPYLDTYLRVCPVAGTLVAGMLEPKKSPIDYWTMFATEWIGTEGADLITSVTGFSHEIVVRITQNAVTAAAMEGWSISRLTRKIMSDLDTVAEYRARRIARTETLRAFSVASRESASRLSIKVRKRWLTAQDGDGDRHAEDARYWNLNGQVREFNEPFDVGGYSAMHPHDVSLPGSESIQCRCTEVYDPV